MSVKIITDSISDISPEIADKYGVEVIPVNVVMSGKTYKDDSSLPQQQLINWIKDNNEFPGFRGINPNEFQKVFQKYSAENTDVIFIAADERIISNYDCAIHAASGIDNIKNTYN